MSFEDLRNTLNDKRDTRDNILEELVSKKERLKHVVHLIALAEEKGNEPDSSHEDEKQQLESDITDLTQQYSGAKNDVKQAHEDLHNLDDHEGLFENLPGDIPVLLFPVRMETRFVENGADNYQIWIRVFPDDIAVQTHELPLTDFEVNEGKKYWKAIWDEQNESKKISAWKSLVKSFGHRRAAWVALKTEPINLEESPTPPEPEFQDQDEEYESWSRQPESRIMPDAFLFKLIPEDTQSFNIKTKQGKPITDRLKLSIDPNDDESLDIDDTNEEIIAGEELEWLTDFDKAVEKGLAVKVGLSEEEYQNGFDKIIALGVRISDDQYRSKEKLENLLDSHHFTSGLSILKQGEPTKSVKNDPLAGFSGVKLSPQLSHQVEREGPLFEPVSDNKQKKDGQRLAEFLGIDYNIVQNILGSDGEDIKNAQTINRLLGPVAVDSQFATAYNMMMDRIGEFKEFFTEFVHARGIIPGIRIGDQPYGILPVTDFEKLEKEAEMENDQLFDDLVEVRNQVDTQISDAADKHEYTGNQNGDNDSFFADVMQKTPVSQNYYARNAYGPQYIWNAMIFKGLSEEANTWWNNQQAHAQNVLNETGLNLSLDNRVLQMAFDKKQTPLNLPVAKDGRLSDKKPLPPLEGSEKNFIQWIAESDIFHVFNKDFSNISSANPDFPKTIFAMLLYQATLYVYRNTAANLLGHNLEERAFPEMENIVSDEMVEEKEKWNLVFQNFDTGSYNQLCMDIGTKEINGEINQMLGQLRNAITQIRTNLTNEEPLYENTINGFLSENEVIVPCLNEGIEEEIITIHYSYFSMFYVNDENQLVYRYYTGESSEYSELVICDNVTEGAGDDTVKIPDAELIWGLNIFLDDKKASFSGEGGTISIPEDLPPDIELPCADFESFMSDYNSPAHWEFYTEIEMVEHPPPEDRPEKHNGYWEVLNEEYEGSTTKDYIANGNTVGTPEGAELDTHLELAEDASSISESEIDLLTREFLDVNSFRTDAWESGLLNKKLFYRRKLQTSERKKGIFLGAYGWLINVKNKNADDDQQENFGFIHAPSLSQANTAAFLASGSRQKNNGTDKYSIDLSSEKVRLALNIIEGLRNGQDLEALLGYDLERGLHEHYPDQNLNQFIFPLRNKFPIQQTTDHDQDTPVDAIAANNVVNGLRLLEAYKSQNPAFPFGITELEEATNDEKDAIEQEILRLKAVFNALNDIATSEEAFLIAQGNPDAGGAIARSLQKGKAPPFPKVIETHRDGINVINRLALHLETVRYNEIDESIQTTSWNEIPVTARVKAEPTINQWAGELLGDPARIKISSTFTENGQPLQKTLSLKELEIHPIDFVFICPDTLKNDDSEISKRIRKYVRKSENLERETNINIEYNAESGELTGNDVSFVEILALVRKIRNVIMESAPLKTTDYIPPEREEREFTEYYDYEDIEKRTESIRDLLQICKDDLNTHLNEFEKDNGNLPDNQKFDNLRIALSKASEFGIRNTIDQYPNDYDEIAFNRLNKVAIQTIALLDKRLIDIESLLPFPHSASDTEKQDHIVKIRKHIHETFGKGLNMLPLFNLQETEKQIIERIEQNNTLLTDHTTPFIMDEWIHGLSKVQKNIRQWEQLVTISEGLSETPDMSRYEAVPFQFPYEVGDRWLALECPEDKIKQNRLCIAAVLPGDWDKNNLQAGLLINDWTEKIPWQKVNTGLAANYDRPRAKAPQALLLATSPSASGDWEWEDLIKSVQDTIVSAKKRMNDYEDLAEGNLGQFVPGIYSTSDFGLATEPGNDNLAL